MIQPVDGQHIRAVADACMMPTYRRQPLVLVRGQGTRVWDDQGRSYLDLVAGIAVASVGHCHPRVVQAIQQQAATLMQVSNLFYTVPQTRLARLLTQLSGLEQVFFCNSGAEANEAAIKLARKATPPGRFEIISALHSFHGRTLASLAATGQVKYHAGFEPLPPGFRHVPFNDLAALEAAVTPQTAAILLEPVQGEGGVHPATPEYLQGVRRLCDERGILLILDEVQTGLGRTGSMFAFQQYGILPDMVTLAKALGGGTAIGALLARRPVAQAFQPGTHASTFGGNPLAAAAALATLEVLVDEDLPGRAAEAGRYFREALARLAARQPAIREIRGLGLLLAVELAPWPQAAQAGAGHGHAPSPVPAESLAPAVVDAARCRGLLINALGPDTLRLVPPLTITPQEIDEAVAILDQALAEVTHRACLLRTV